LDCVVLLLLLKSNGFSLLLAHLRELPEHVVDLAPVDRVCKVEAAREDKKLTDSAEKERSSFFWIFLADSNNLPDSKRLQYVACVVCKENQAMQ
jgi:hypothetical protein